MKRFLSSPFFLIALIAFFLPFFAVTCGAGAGGGDLLEGLGGEQAQQATEVTGLELVTGQAEENLEDTGQTPEIPGVGPSPGIPGTDAGAGESEPVDLGMAQIWAIAAAAIALLGIFLSLLAGRAGGALALALGAAGAAVLFLLSSEFTSAIDDAVGQEAEAFISVENRMGYWLAIGGFVVAGVTGLVRLLLPDQRTYPPAGAAGFGGPTTGAPPAGPPPAGPPPAGPPPAAPPPATPPPPASPGGTTP